MMKNGNIRNKAKRKETKTKSYTFVMKTSKTEKEFFSQSNINEK